MIWAFSISFLYCLDGITDILCAQVLEYSVTIVFAPAALKCFGAVVLAVGTREYRNEYCSVLPLYVCIHIPYRYCKVSLLLPSSVRRKRSGTLSPGSPVHAFRCLFHGDRGTAILEGCLVGYLTDHGVAEWTALPPCPSGTSQTILPQPAAKKSLGSTLCSIFTPRLVAKCHLADSLCQYHAPSTAYAEIMLSSLHILR